jgi:hypothetical protein
MRAEIEVLGKKFLLKSRLVNSGVPFPWDDHEERDHLSTYHNAFSVAVHRLLDDGGKVIRNFTFYDSQANYEKGIDDLDEFTLKWAFRCFLDDGLSATYDFEEFCGEFGYDTDSRRAERMYKACQRSLDKLRDLGIFDSELCDMINALSEQGIE